MKKLPLNETFSGVAKRVIWFESPNEALQDTVRFVAYAMTHATFDDMQTIREQLSDDE